MLRLIKAAVSAGLFLAAAAPLSADQWRSPSPLDLRSPDGRLQVHIAPAKEGSYSQATLTGPEGEKRVFKLLNPVAPVDAILFDDGTLLALDNWHSMGYGAVLSVYSRSGALLWSAELEKLFPADIVARIPTSVSSRWWRRNPFEWTSEEDEAGQRWVRITLWNEDRLRVRLADGAVRYMPVADLGDDPERLLRRGEDLYRQGDHAGAAAVLRRAIGLDPHLLHGYRLLAWVLRDQEDFTGMVEVLLAGIRANPPEPLESSRGRFQGDPRLWLPLELARAYAKAGRPAEAEAAYQECLRLDPGYWDAARELARLWLEQGRDAEADRLLGPFAHAAPEVGDVYREGGRLAMARRYYEAGYREGSFDLHLALHLAEVLEKLGDTAAALSVLQKTREWLAGLAHHDFYRKKVEEDIRRLSGTE
ncbi:MAG TPA: tetratricopeptide repeat protein [Thermoanaerobaculia bacterium]